MRIIWALVRFALHVACAPPTRAYLGLTHLVPILHRAPDGAKGMSRGMGDSGRATAVGGVVVVVLHTDQQGVIHGCLTAVAFLFTPLGSRRHKDAFSHVCVPK